MYFETSKQKLIHKSIPGVVVVGSVDVVGAAVVVGASVVVEIGRASCRERV